MDDIGDTVYSRVFGALTFGGQALGRAFTYAPDLGKAKLAAAKLFTLFDRKSAIDSSDPTGGQPVSLSCGITIIINMALLKWPLRFLPL